MKTNRLFKSVRTSLMRMSILVGIVLSGLVTFGHGVQLRWNIVPNTGAIRVWVEHWHGDVSGNSYTTFPLNVSYTVGGVTTSQTYYASGYSNNTAVANLPGGGNSSTYLSSCSGNANYYNDWVYWDFNPPACNTPVALTIINGPTYLTEAACGALYNKTIYSNFNDNSGPAITANDIFVSPTNASNCTAVVNNFGVSASDACGGSVTTTYSIAEGSSFAVGSTAVTVTSTDANSNTSTATFNVVVGDNQAPTVLTQGMTVALSGGTASVTSAQIDNGSYDNACGGIASMVVSPSTFGCSNVGANTVTLTVTDVSGNVATGTATVIVTSDLAATATASDANCFNVCDGSVALNITGGNAPYGILAGDLNHTFTGTTIDNTLFTFSGSYSQNGTLSTNVASNNGWQNYFRTTATMARTAGKTFEFKFYSTDFLANMVGWYGTNSANAVNQYQNLVHSFYFYNNQLHIYEDGNYTNPNYNLQNNSWYDCKIELQANGAKYYIKTANSANYTLVYTSNSSSESDLSPGMTYYDHSYYYGAEQTDDWKVGNGGSSNTTNLCAGNYNMTIMDASGCTTGVNFTVNQPSAALATGITANLSACSTENFTISSSATSGGTAPYSYSWNMGDGTTLTGSSVTHVYTTLGAKTITLTATDANGCTDVQTSSTNVMQCNVAPVAVCQNLSVTTDANCQAVVMATAIDGGSTDANGDVMTFVMSPAGPFNVGTHNVTLTVSDPAGLSSTCNSTITVTDATAPMAMAQNVTVQLDASGNGSTTAAAVNNGSSDACGIASMTINNASFTCANVGSNNPVMLTVTDVNGNVSTASAMVTVEDNVNPVAVAQNVTVQLDASGNGSTTAALVNNGSSDACGIASMTINNASFTCANVGSNNPVMLTVTDNNGNVSTASAMVTVEDNVAPVAVAQNVTVQLDASGNGSTTVALVNNGSSDACGIASMTINNASFTCANVGSNNPVTLTVTDVNGNVSTASAMVTVEDNVNPVAVAQNVTVQLDASGNGSTTAALVNNGSSDACGIASMTINNASFTCANVGSNNPVMLTVTDNNGNVSTASAMVTVEDNVAPVAVAQNVTVQLDASGNGSTTVALVNNGSSDACGIASMTINNASFTCANVGSNNPVTLTVTDVNGNVSTASAMVTVEDNVAPVAMCQAVSVTLANGMASVTPMDVDNGSNDACGIASMTLSEDTWTCGDIGNHTVTLTVTDNNGNVSSCNAVVTVIGEVPTCSIASIPTSSTYTGGVSTTLYIGYGAQSTTLSCTPTGGSSFTYAWTGSNLSSSTSSNPVFTPTSEGIYNFSVLVTNNNGCETTCSISICVRDIRVYSKKGKLQKNKVYLCHVPPGNNNNPQTLSVSVNAIASHLSNHFGDALGTCNSSCGTVGNSSKTGEMFTDEFEGQDVDVILYPNPSTDHFSVMVESEMEEMITIEVYDMAGNIVERTEGQFTYHEIEMGRNLASGIYMVVITQGNYRKVLRASMTK